MRPLAKPMTSGAKAAGRFGKQDFAHPAEDDVYRWPAGEIQKYYLTAEEHGLRQRHYWTNACRTCAPKSRCTTAPQRRTTRWEHEHVLPAVQRRLDANPNAMRARRTTFEHPFGTIKSRMGATHFRVKGLLRVATEMALHVLAHSNKPMPTAVMGIKRPDFRLCAGPKRSRSRGGPRNLCRWSISEKYAQKCSPSIVHRSRGRLRTPQPRYHTTKTHS
jgi:hypothetical protein